MPGSIQQAAVTSICATSERSFTIVRLLVGTTTSSRELSGDAGRRSRYEIRVRYGVVGRIYHQAGLDG